MTDPAMPGAEPAGDRRPALVTLLVDLVLPLGAYVVMRMLGADAATALVTGTAVALARLVWVTARTRRFDAFGALLLLILVLSLASAIVTGEERILLARDSVISTIVGVVLLVSCALRRPLGFAAAKSISGERDQRAWDARWDADAALRRSFMVMTMVWGWGFLVEAVTRLPLVYLVPVDWAVALTTVLQIVVVALLATWTVGYVRRRDIRAHQAVPQRMRSRARAR